MTVKNTMCQDMIICKVSGQGSEINSDHSEWACSDRGPPGLQTPRQHCISI